MSDLELLFLALAAVYLFECAWWVPRGSVAFCGWFGRVCQVANPGAILGNQRGGFVLTNPLPPLGSLLSASQLPLSFSPEAVLAFVAPSVNPGSRPPQTGRVEPWEAIEHVQAEARKVTVNGKLLVQAVSPGVARDLADKLQVLSKTPPTKRGQAIEQMVRAAFDTRAIADHLGRLAQHGRGLRLMTNGLFWYLFLAGPLVVWHFGIRLAGPCLAAVLYCGTLAIALVFRRAHWRLYPRAVDERFSQALQVALWPVTAIRALDLLSRPLLERFHPVAVAATCCAPEVFRSLARSVLLEVRHPAWPRCPSPERMAADAEANGRLVLQKQLEQFLADHGLDPDELLQPPERADETCRSYCPRCHSQFTTVQGVCEDCGGLPLVAFNPQAPVR